MIESDGIEIVKTEIFPEIPGPDAGHPQSRQGPDFMEAHLQELAGHDWIEMGIVGPGAVPGLEQGDGFMQIMDDRRMVVKEHPENSPGHRHGLLVGVAVDVDVDIVAPVGRRLPGKSVIIGPALEIPIEPVHHLFVAVRLRDRVDQDHHLPADLLDHGQVGYRQTISQLHTHLGAPGLVGMEPGIEVIDRAGTGNDYLRRVRVRPPGVGERRRGLFQERQIPDAGFVRNGDEDDLPALLGLADDLDMDTRRSLG